MSAFQFTHLDHCTVLITDVAKARHFYGEVLGLKEVPAPREFEGQVIPVGFDVVAGSYTSFHNPLTQLPLGERSQVELRVTRQGVTSNTPREELNRLTCLFSRTVDPRNLNLGSPEKPGGIGPV